MAHVFVLVEGRKVWMDLFESDISKRRYYYNALNGQRHLVQPNVREVKLFDISVPEQSIPQLLSDLAPFAHTCPSSTQSPQKDKAVFLAKALRVMSGLNPIYPEQQVVQTRWAKVPVVGKYLNKIVNVFKPEVFPEKEFRASGEIRRKWMNVIPIGWHEDGADPEAIKGEFANLPKTDRGGELL